MRFYQPNWSIETGGWSLDLSEGMLTLCPADVDAALQVSYFEKTTGTVTQQELQSLAENDLANVDPVPATCGEFTGYYGEFVEGEAFCRKWFVSSGKSHLFVTYNCGVEHKERHIDVVDWMLSKLKPEDRS
jgi:hypothetical protein